jgi:hypothetical protein
MMVKAGGVDSNEWFRSVMELFVGRRRPWVTPVTGAQQFESNPPSLRNGDHEFVPGSV